MDTDVIRDFGAHLATLLEGSDWVVDGSPATPWAHASSPSCPPHPAQGWKLHLSANHHTAVTVLERAAPILVASLTSFKVASTLQMLITLNQGQAGASQIGKFMTIYPVDDDAAVQLARSLDGALADLGGPTIPSDRTLREGGVVRYRYGSFATRWMQQPTGEIAPALVTPDGRLVPDTRSRRDAVPDWTDDPFAAAGLVQPPSTPPVLIADRFRPITTLYRSPHSAIFLAVDVQDLQRCVLKRATIDDDEWGPAQRLVHEHEMLTALADVPGVVKSIGWFDDGNERALALEDIPGTFPLADALVNPDRSYALDPADVARVGRDLSAIVAELHRRGIVHRDIKPTNTIIQTDGVLRLIDLELAARVGSGTARGYGSMGYVGPEQHRREPPDPADDVYAIGATMFSLAIGVDISSRPADAAPDIRALMLDVPVELSEVVERCLAPTRAERYRDAGELYDALCALDHLALVPLPDYGTLGSAPADGAKRARSFARRMADSLCADAVETESGTTWVSRHPASPGIPSRDINTGASGTLLALIELAQRLPDPDPRYRSTIAAAASWIDAAPRPEGELLGGLYVGEGGVAAGLLRAGQFLGDDTLLESACRRSRDIAGLPHRSPDIFNGTAGRLRMHLWIADALGDDGAMAAAMAAARHLIATADRPAPGRATWTVLPEFGGNQQLGYAHGTAGIADALLDLADATGDDAIRATALDAGRWLIDQAEQGPNGSVAFPSEAGGRPWAPLWCHGPTGIGRFLLHLHRSGGLEPEHRWMLTGTGVAAARHGRTLGPVMCHGIAGSVDHLLDLHQVEPTAGHLAEAWSLAELLESFHVEGDDGQLRTLSDHPGVSTPDLTVGYAGIATVWLRLADPALPTLLAGRA